MMIFFQKPEATHIRNIIRQKKNEPLSYTDIGATESTSPAGFIVDHNRICLGSGRVIFEKAKKALREWEMVKLSWVRFFPPDPPLREGDMTGMIFGIPGFWTLNFCRIVRIYEEENRFGFAYGTLQCHAECGEERFLVEWNRDNDSVWYDILAFSRPQHFLAKCAKPFVRLMQKKFARDSMHLMSEYCIAK